MRAPDRDQTPTKEALAEFDIFFKRYPDSPLTARSQGRNGVSLAIASAPRPYGVGVGYYRRSLVLPAPSTASAKSCATTPGSPGIDGVYYHLAECLHPHR